MASTGSSPSGKRRWNPFKSKSSSLSDWMMISLEESGPDSKPHGTINNYIHGGQGGSGGSGGVQGQGGSGGIGEGPTLHYHIKAEHFTMNTHDTGLAVTSSAMMQASQAINHCPPPSQIFHGRQAILDSMQEFFAKDTGKQKIYVLYGLGGAGKTQIALKFIEEWTNFTDQFFIDASNKDTIETGLKNIAVTKETGKASQDALIWLARKREEWLLFLDNADDPTFNLNHVRIHGAHFEVSNMEKSDAVALLLKSAQCETSAPNETLATEIVKQLFKLEHSFQNLKPLAHT
ncbi:FabD/lysophospholipase-like protein [Mycena sanguinolenta]|uniref:FabD/lysophospholipase-like protein n=1 Tax=Mycena sanguinolenta TaxID=230812 RepID=A0A8H6XKE5_9AGAR|nr:FabD/lysophospholipase-like protein [Mycena sanguinolenta]